MANNHTITEFINGFNGGLRTNRFVVNCDKAGFGQDRPFHIRAASLPAVSTSVIQVPHRGRVFKMPGQRTFAPWSITVLDDTVSNDLWLFFYNWANTIQNHVSNTSGASNGDFTDQMAQFTIKQLTLNGSNKKIVTLNRAWPSEVGEIRLSADDAESLSSFTVQLEYQYIDNYSLV
jgi:hypothetical protein